MKKIINKLVNKPSGIIRAIGSFGAGMTVNYAWKLSSDLAIGVSILLIALWIFFEVTIEKLEV